MEKRICFQFQHANRALCIAAGLLLCGCSMLGLGSSVPEIKPAEPVTANYNITFSATREANINQENVSVPVKITVFNLRSDTSFKNADFFSLQNQAATVLTDKLMGSEQFFLLPGGEEINVSGEKPAGRYYVGVTGEFQDLNNKTWRLVLPIENAKRPPFYKFWNRTPPTQVIKIIADRQGLRIEENSAEEKKTAEKKAPEKNAEEKSSEEIPAGISEGEKGKN